MCYHLCFHIYIWDYIYYHCYKKELTKKITDCSFLRNTNGRTADLCKKDITSIFKTLGFNIIRQIPNSFGDRLLKNSSNQEIFEKSKAEHEEALSKSGCSTKLSYTNNLSHNHNASNRNSNSTSFCNNNGNKNRKRNIIWFNPPSSINVKKNIGKNFLQLIDKPFLRSSKLHKIFHHNTVKVSYSCTLNFQ